MRRVTKARAHAPQRTRLWPSPPRLAAATALDDSEQRPACDAGRTTAAPLRTGRLHWPRTHARSGRAASAPSGRVPTTATAGESERTAAATVERLLIVPSVAERTPPPPGRPSGHARPARGRRGRRRRPTAQSGLSRYRRPPEAAWSSSTSSRRPVEPARRPDRLAVYMGCCANRGEDPVIAGPPAWSAVSIMLAAQRAAFVEVCGLGHSRPERSLR
jgi:hypothetical protein